MKNLKTLVTIFMLTTPILVLSQKASEKEKFYKNEFGTDLGTFKK